MNFLFVRRRVSTAARAHETRQLSSLHQYETQATIAGGAYLRWDRLLERAFCGGWPMNVKPWRFPVAVLGMGLQWGCHPAADDSLRRAVIARVGTANVEIVSMREVPARVAASSLRPVPMGAAICGELKGAPHNMRYFIWERASGKVYLADESGVVSGASSPFFWRSYCT